MSRIKLSMLGESQIEVGATHVRPSATHFFSLLLYTAVERGRQIPRAELASQLFPDVPERESSHSLRQLIYRAKRLGAPIATTLSSIHVESSAVDDEITQLLTSKRVPVTYLRPGHLSILPHFDPPTSSLSEWLERYRDRVRTTLLQLLAADIQAARTMSNWRLVGDISRAILDLDPFNETATLCAAEALARSGSKREAVNLLREFELEVGKSADSLALPPRLLARRIAESHEHTDGLVDTPLLGRDEDMQKLEAFWARARDGRFMSVVVFGAESIGKTHLVTAFASSVRICGGAAVLLSRRSPLDIQRPMSVFADIAKDLLSLRGAAGCSPESLSSIARLTKTNQVNDVAGSDGRDTEFIRIGVSRAIVDILDSILAERPLLLILDDADHLDDSSLSLLRDLERRLAARPCMVLRVARFPRHERQDGPRLRIGPLDHAAACKVAETVNSGFAQPLSQDALLRCVSFAAGNPGHLRLLMLDRVRSRHDDDDVPIGILASIDAQLGTLSPKSLHLLQACAVFGSACPINTAAALTGLRGYALVRSMQELEDNALIALRSGGLECTSSLVQKRVLRASSRATTAVFHLRAARHLERDPASKSPSQSLAWTIAEHWHNAGVASAALRWKQRCWQQLVSIGQPLAALESSKAALLQSGSIRERATILLSMATAFRALGDFASLGKVLEERIALGAEVDDSRALRSALSFDLFEATADGADMQPCLAPLAEYVRDPGLDNLRRLRACRLLMAAADQLFDSDAAHDGFDALKHIHVSDPGLELLKLQSSLIYHTVFGDRCEGLECVARIERLASCVEGSWLRMTSATSCLIARRVMAPSPSPTGDAERAFADCSEYGVHHSALKLSSLLAVCHFDDGNIAQAQRWANAAAKLAELVPFNQVLTDFFASQVDLALLDNSLNRAEAWARILAERVGNTRGHRIKREQLVYRVKVNQFRGQGTSDLELDELLHFHRLGGAFGRHDDNMEVLWVALTERGATDIASELLRAYLTSTRREVRPCNYFLRIRTQADSAWSSRELSHLR